MSTKFNFALAIRKLRMRHFELLSALGSEKSVRAAARQMSLTPPAVSKMLREIEDCFGTRLFERSQSGVVASIAGRTLVARAISFVNELAAAGENVDNIVQGASATIRVGTFSVIPRVPIAIAHVREKIPNVIVHLREGTGVSLLDALIKGELDCIVGALPPELLRASDVEALRVQSIETDRLCVMAEQCHSLARARRLTWAALVDAQWVLPPKDSLLRRALIDAHLLAGLRPPVPVVEMLSPVLLAELLLRDTSLLGVMRFEQARAAQASGRLRIVALKPEMPLPPLAFITRRTAVEEATALSAFRSACREFSTAALNSPRTRRPR